MIWAIGPIAERPTRQRFTAECKAPILAEYDRAERTEEGVILRREDPYSSDLVEWPKVAETGAQAGPGTVG
jgi:transposase